LSNSDPKQQNHINQARASLQQALSWYSSFRRHQNYPPDLELQAAVRKDLQTLKSALDKLDQKVIKIAAFGLVSRGKSAVLNALLGQKILETGPLHGVTRWPISVRWLPPNSKLQVELIDTPGLDEIEGQVRAEMAREVAYQADLILFVVAGDITRTEYQALWELKQNQKPLILIFNKIDLYPDTDRETIYQQLQQLGSNNNNQAVLFPDEVIMVSAEPQPLQVRVEWPDGKVSEEWETPPPQILNKEGRSLLALNALFQARNAEMEIAKKTLELRENEAEEIIWKYAQYKALAVAINPIALVDIFGGVITDLALIRSLARLYGLPMTSHEASRLWRTIIVSSSWFVLSEIATATILGLGKTGSAIMGALENPIAFTTYLSTALVQGGIAGYGSYTVGKAAQVYLKNGCTWGAFGPSSAIQEILNQVEPNTIIYRLRDELEQQLIQAHTKWRSLK
jgi:uncharacterized protein